MKWRLVQLVQAFCERFIAKLDCFERSTDVRYALCKQAASDEQAMYIR